MQTKRINEPESIVIETIPKEIQREKTEKINEKGKLGDNNKEDSIQSRFCVTRVEEKEEKEKYLKK